MKMAHDFWCLMLLPAVVIAEVCVTFLSPLLAMLCSTIRFWEEPAVLQSTPVSPWLFREVACDPLGEVLWQFCDLGTELAMSQQTPTWLAPGNCIPASNAVTSLDYTCLNLGKIHSSLLLSPVTKFLSPVTKLLNSENEQTAALSTDSAPCTSGQYSFGKNPWIHCQSWGMWFLCCMHKVTENQFSLFFWRLINKRVRLEIMKLFSKNCAQ